MLLVHSSPNGSFASTVDQLSLELIPNFDGTDPRANTTCDFIVFNARLIGIMAASPQSSESRREGGDDR